MLLDVLSLPRRSQYEHVSFVKVWDGLCLFHNVDTSNERRGDADTNTKNLIYSGLLSKSNGDGFVKM